MTSTISPPLTSVFASVCRWQDNRVPISGYAHFLNDTSGSPCELVDLDDEKETVLASVTDNTLLV